MAEVIFVLTTIFVAYVVYAVSADQYADIKSMRTQRAPTPKASPAPAQPETTTRSAPAAAEATTTSPASTRNQIKNPHTGELASIPNNYRFAKRWIKDALVSEGLLDKVYKTRELDDAVNANIKTALEQLAALEKYQA
ncbi:MAG: hypothetical protein RQ715_05305 [Methylococcales bacterium]|nr:hypothetical protein [Methylococcales bacterium]